jgi:transposase InsO family protein
VLPYKRRSSRFVTNLQFSKRTRHVACASIAATGSCGWCCTDAGPVGGDVSRWFSPTPFSVGSAELSPGIGPENRAAIPARPEVGGNIRDLIRRMSQANPFWGAPRIHGELLKLGIAVAQSTVARYLPRSRKPPSQTWRTFLTNHLAQTAAIDFFTVPAATFRVLFVFVVLTHERRRVLHFGVTEHPTQEWSMQQMREAFPWDEATRYVLRDRDAIYGKDFAAMIRAMGMKEVLTAPRSPWQNSFAERLVGSIRRECLDHVIVWNERSANTAELFCLLSVVTYAFILGQRRP